MSTPYEIPGHLARGKACNPCRKRKMKCDGNRPKCNQCMRFGREHECEFAEVVQPSTARVLEQHIARLESRIQELAHEDPSAVKLHDPHAAYRQVGSTSAGRPQWWEVSEPPPQVAQTIINFFLPHATKLGFFLDINKFLATFFNPTISKPRPPSVLRDTVYLWGIRLSGDGQFRAHESSFLNRSLRGIHVSLSNGHLQDALYVLQAEILLSYYFFHSDRMMEGKFHSNAAVSLAIMCNLHKLWGPSRSSNMSSTSSAKSPLDLQPELVLPAPKDILEEGERIHAWWSVFILDKSWVEALGSPSTIIDDDRNSVTRIDTPWPLPLNQYEHASRSNSGKTLKTFLESIASGRVDHANSPLAMHAKVSLLYEKAARLAPLIEQDIAGNQNDFTALDGTLERLKQLIPTPDRVDLSSMSVCHDLLVIHSLIQSATILLHHRFVTQNATSRSRCLTAANTMIRLLQTLPIKELKFVNPILAFLWTTASEVILIGLKSLHSMRSTWASSGALPGEDALLAAFLQIRSTLEHFAMSSPLMNTQLSKVRQLRSNI